MMPAVQKILSFIFFLVIALLITGGIFYRSDKLNLELSQINVFCAILLFALVVKRESILDFDFTKHFQKLFERGSRFAEKQFAFELTSLLLFFLFFLGHLVKHWTFGTHMGDITFVHQPLFYPFEEKLLHCNVCRNGTQLAEHLAWIFFVLAPITSLFKSDTVIFLIKNLAVVGGLWFFIKNGPLKNLKALQFWTLLLCAMSFPLKKSQIWDFREDDFAFLFLLVGLWGLYERKFVFYFAGFAAAILCKENIWFVTAGAGFSLVLFSRWYATDLLKLRTPHPSASQKQILIAGLSTVAASLIYGFLAIRVFTPHWLQGAEQTSNILIRLPGLGNTLGEAFIHALTQPWLLLPFLKDGILQFSSFKYLAVLLAPFVVLAWREWRWMLPALAGIFMNLITPLINQRMLIFHYELIILPFLIFGLCLAVKKLAQQQNEAMPMKSSETLGSFEAAAPWLWAFVVAGCFAGRGPLFEITDRLIWNSKWIPITAEMRSLPGDEPIATDMKSLGQLSYRKQIRVLMIPPGNPTGERLTDLKRYVAENVKKQNWEIAADPKDAKIWMILQDSWGQFMTQELKKLGGKVQAQWPKESPEVVVIEMVRSPFDLWCENELICRSR